jgi:hypothetical protein
MFLLVLSIALRCSTVHDKVLGGKKKNLTNYCDLKATITNEQCLMALKYSDVKRVESKKKKKKQTL